MKKSVVILGSTGSIGRATLDVIATQKDSFEVFGLACKENIELLNAQIKEWKPQYVCVYDDKAKHNVSHNRTRILTGIQGIKKMLAMDNDIVVNALPGSIGLEPTIETLKYRKVLALANKESLVMAGRIISKMMKEEPATLIPVDSEHSALFQLLKTIDREELKNIIITASGGPFKDYKKEDLEHVTTSEALNHPTWKMGTKVTLDSATLMNKGLEVIEAHWLFDIHQSRIKVLVHPESILHGLIEMIDGSILSYMAYPDMKIPIAFALNQGTRLSLPFPVVNFEHIMKLTFYPPDMDKFPSLKLAFTALEQGDSAAIVLNAANEVASQAFMDGKIRFSTIPVLIEEAIERHPRTPVIDSIEAVWEIHEWAIAYTERQLRKFYG
jgi:1-deoxy-D-xylulose-5-phosphate reductoisomerase